ncbi:hypothetical protein P9112_012864 [Eukaryota sp. TZLM1-RC]
MPLTFDLLCDPNINLLQLTHHASEDTKVGAVWTNLWLEKSQVEVASLYAVNQSTLSRWIRQAFCPKDRYLKTIAILNGSDRKFIISTLEHKPD